MTDYKPSCSFSEVGSRILRDTHTSEKCKIVPLGFQHTDNVIKWRNNPEIAQWFSTKNQFERSSHEAWLNKAYSSNTDFNWVIENSECIPVGMISLYNVNWIDKKAEFGRLLIGEWSARGKGLARAATDIVLHVARKSNLTELYLDVISTNSAAYSMYKKIGFKETDLNNNLIRMQINLN